MDENYLNDIPADLKAEIDYDLKVQRAEWKHAEALMKSNRRQSDIWKEMKSLIDNGNPKDYYFLRRWPRRHGEESRVLYLLCCVCCFIRSVIFNCAQSFQP